MRNFNLYTKNKCAIIALYQIVAISLCSCSIPKKEKRDLSQTDTNSTIETTIATTSNEISSTSTTVSEDTENTEATLNTTYINDIGEVFVKDPKYLSKKDFVAISNRIYDYGYLRFGVDSPAILDQARAYFKDDTLTLEDVGFIQSQEIGDNDTDIINVKDTINYLQNQGFFMDLSRYVLSLQGNLPMKYSFNNEFFKTYFYDYWSETQKGNYSVLDNSFMFDNKYYYDLKTNYDIHGMSSLRDFLGRNLDDPDAREAVKFFIYNELGEYNLTWYKLAGTYSSYIGFMPITETVDYEYVAIPSSATSDKLQDIVSKAPNCQDLDISKPETYDDLLNSGVDVDLIEKAFDYCGLEIPKLSEQKDKSNSQQRTIG